MFSSRRMKGYNLEKKSFKFLERYHERQQFTLGGDEYYG